MENGQKQWKIVLKINQNIQKPVWPGNGKKIVKNGLSLMRNREWTSKFWASFYVITQQKTFFALTLNTKELLSSIKTPGHTCVICIKIYRNHFLSIKISSNCVG